jgi:cytoskeletal protein CcmA (bactofilin family)
VNKKKQKNFGPGRYRGRYVRDPTNIARLSRRGGHATHLVFIAASAGTGGAKGADMFNKRKPEVPEDQVAKFKPDPAPVKPLFPPPSEAVIPAPLPPAPLPPVATVPALPGSERTRIPTLPKEALTMSNTRSHFPTPPGGANSSSSSNTAPQQSVRTTLRGDAAERRVLVIGKGISISGTISDAERVVVEGTLESQLVRAAEFSIAPGGFFKGEAEVDEAEVAGTLEGTITARASLQVRAPGKLFGVARCRRLQVEDGGQISGKVEMLTDPLPESAAALAEVSAAAPAVAAHNETWPSAMPIKPDLIG